MTLNDNAVLIAARGYVYTGDIGKLPPKATELSDIDVETFGAHIQKLKTDPFLGSSTFTLTAGSAGTTAALTAENTSLEVQLALEAVLGEGNVLVTGDDLEGSEGGYEVAIIGDLHGEELALTTSDSYVTVTDVEEPNGWANIGHTSREDMPEFGYDGGEYEVRGSWQKQRIRQHRTGDPIADYVTLHLEQFDQGALELYYGKDYSDIPGEFGVSGRFIPVEKSLLVLVVDGENCVGFHASKASFTRDDGVDMPIDNFASMPVKATFLNYQRRSLYTWISEAFA